MLAAANFIGADFVVPCVPFAAHHGSEINNDQPGDRLVVLELAEAALARNVMYWCKFLSSNYSHGRAVA